MFDHIGLKARDLNASVRFYERALESLGHVLCCRDDASAGFGPAGEPALWLLHERAAPVKAAHIALRAPDRGCVDRFHAAGLGGGGHDNGAPGLRTDYSPSYYAAFLIDPDGNNIEAVCTR